MAFFPQLGGVSGVGRGTEEGEEEQVNLTRPLVLFGVHTPNVLYCLLLNIRHIMPGYDARQAKCVAYRRLYCYKAKTLKSYRYGSL